MDQRRTTPPSGEQISRSPIFKRILASADDYLRKPLRIKKLLNDAYQRGSHKRDVGQLAHDVWENLQILFRMIRAAAAGRYRGIPTGTLLGAVAVVLYFMSPIDAIPDIIPALGLLDDAALLAWFMTSVKDEMDRFRNWEHSDEARAAAVELTTADGTLETVPVGEHRTLQPQPEVADLGAEAHSQPEGAAAHDHSVRVNTTDGTREPLRDHGSADSGGNVR